jgi:Glycosyl hydrolase family 79 C-terminal beta domain
MFSRRTFTGNLFKLSAAMAVPPELLNAADAGNPRELRLAGRSAIEIPANFTGLGYEMLSVATPGLLSAENHRYVELVRGLGARGVLRLGGIVANYTRYAPNDNAVNEPKNTVITRAALRQFAEFLHATGWTTIWSVNFAQGSTDGAVEEARAVKEVLGARLLALEIGNEVDSYGKAQPFRTNPYTYEEYRKEFGTWCAAIAKAVPGIRFAAPDTAQNVDWVERMAKDAKGEVQLLTTHYYRNAQSRGSAEQLLSRDARLENIAARMRAASEQSGIPWRMCEINSFSGGGRPGVSDTLIGALWTLDAMLLLAENGCSGVNMETGVNQLGFVSSYSPIQDDGKGVNSAGAPYYGMLAFAAAMSGCDQMLPIEEGALGAGLSAYAFGSAGRPRSIVVVNMASTDAAVSVARLGTRRDMGRASILRLSAPGPDSKTGITFGGAAVDAAGRWKPESKEMLRETSFVVPRMSAAVVRP